MCTRVGHVLIGHPSEADERRLSLVPYRIREVAERANVPEDFVRQLIELGALPGEEAGQGSPEVRRSRLL
jgi:hypothetical protein